MDEQARKSLLAAGLPVECCPDCERSDWTCECSTRLGWLYATCTYCRRNYTGMPASGQYAHLARLAAEAAQNHDIVKLREYQARLTYIWDNYPQLENEGNKLVCTSRGRLNRDDDDIPF